MFSRLLGRIINTLGAAGFIALMVMMLVVVINIIIRLFGKGILGTYEIAELSMVLFTSYALGYAAVQKAHVTVSVVIARFTKSTQRIFYVITTIFTLGIWLLIAWYSLVFAGDQWLIDEHTNIMGCPIYPFRYYFVLGALVLCLVLLSDIITAIKESARK